MTDVRGLLYLQVLVAGIVPGAAYLLCSVEESQAMLCGQADDSLPVKLFGALLLQSRWFSQQEEPHDAPEIIEPVGVKEFHAPPLAWWRKTAQEQHACSSRKEWFQGMLLYGHFACKGTENCSVGVCLCLRKEGSMPDVYS